MIDQEIQELREWSAGVMGWESKELIDEYGNNVGEWHKDGSYTGYDAYYIHSDGEDVSYDLSFLWRPDTDLNQCFMLVKKMEALGWRLHLCVPGMMYPDKISAGFSPLKECIMPQHYHKEESPSLAILLAARETGVK